MNSVLYNNIWTLMDEVRLHSKENNSTIVSLDDREKLFIGWQCEKTQKYFYTKLLYIRTREALSQKEADKIAYDKMTDLITSPSTRQIIAEYMSHKIDIFEFIPLERKKNILAFW